MGYWIRDGAFDFFHKQYFLGLLCIGITSSLLAYYQAAPRLQIIYTVPSTHFIVLVLAAQLPLWWQSLGGAFILVIGTYCTLAVESTSSLYYLIKNIAVSMTGKASIGIRVARHVAKPRNNNFMFQ